MNAFFLCLSSPFFYAYFPGKFYVIYRNYRFSIPCHLCTSAACYTNHTSSATRIRMYKNLNRKVGQKCHTPSLPVKPSKHTVHRRCPAAVCTVRFLKKSCRPIGLPMPFMSIWSMQTERMTPVPFMILPVTLPLPVKFFIKSAAVP